MAYPLRLGIFLNKGSPHLSLNSITICTCWKPVFKIGFSESMALKMAEISSKMMIDGDHSEIVSSLSHAVVALRKDALSNRVIVW